MHRYRVKRTLEDFLGFSRICGVDEAGRGALAGPVVAAAVILPEHLEVFGKDVRYIKDSKKLSFERIHHMHDLIKEHCIVGVGIVDHHTIDQINIHRATYKAMVEAIQVVEPSVALIDGHSGPPYCPVPFMPIVKGDQKEACISAASIVAKFTRDNIMLGYDLLHPEFNFKQNKGYGTPEHMQLIRDGHVSTIHRYSFNPLKSL